jgi:hypothetical protein
MQVLRLADQKSPSMDKLNYYVLQTDQMLAMYCKDAEERGVGLLTAPTIRAMDCSPSAGLSDDSGSERDLGCMANLKLVDKRVKELVELNLQVLVEVRTSSGR